MPRLTLVLNVAAAAGAAWINPQRRPSSEPTTPSPAGIERLFDAHFEDWDHRAPEHVKHDFTQVKQRRKAVKAG